jgi:hypothetical protein
MSASSATAAAASRRDAIGVVPAWLAMPRTSPAKRTPPLIEVTTPSGRPSSASTGPARCAPRRSRGSRPGRASAPRSMPASPAGRRGASPRASSSPSASSWSSQRASNRPISAPEPRKVAL